MTHPVDVTRDADLAGLTWDDLQGVEDAELRSPRLDKARHELGMASVECGRNAWLIGCGIITEADVEAAQERASKARLAYFELKARLVVAYRQIQARQAETGLPF